MIKFLQIIFFSIISVTILFENKIHGNTAETVYSEDAVFSFIENLASSGDYHRAHIELYRLKYYYPGSLGYVDFYISDLYFLFKQNEYDRVIENATRHDYSDPLLSAAGFIFSYDAYIYHQKKAAPDFDLSFFLSPVSEPLREYLITRKFYYLLSIEEFDSARSLTGNYDYLNSYEYLVDYSEKSGSLMKNPGIALTMGIVPGMGYVYSGDYGTGFVSFIITALNYGISYLAYRSNNDAIAITTGSIGFFFHLGSMTGGYMSSQRWNTRVMNRNHAYLIQELEMDRHRKEIMERYGISYE